jgi:hypothetical protein
MNQTIYERDFNLWLETTINNLKNHNFEALDIDNLVEELRDLGKSDQSSLESNLTILLAHLLKLKVQYDAPEMMKRNWDNSVDEHRTRIDQQLGKIPSLKRYFNTVIEQSYHTARKLAIKEGKRASFGVRIPNENEYPTTCPFDPEQILDEDFYGIS